ncbi:MAG TPA: hypothetical protein VHY08_22940 [Bacillota bacterium]|nr:hypothetical protein [Bacillota bacterium]
MFKNKVFLGVFAGLASTIVKDAINQVLYSFKIIKILFAQYAVGVFIKTVETKSLPGIVTGYFIDFGLSALLGIIFVFLLVKTKPIHLLFQGFLFGIAMFICIYGALLSFGISSVRERPLLDVILMFFIHLIYGLVLGLFVQKFGKKAFEVSWTDV